MVKLSRRTFLAGASAAWDRSRVFAGARSCPLKIGVMDGMLRLSSDPKALEAASRLGFAAVQVTLGLPGADGHLPLANPDLQDRFLEASRRFRIPMDATYLDVLHVECLKNDPAARERVLSGIEITKRLNAKILMTVFFGKCSLMNHEEIDHVADMFRELAPVAERAGVIIGFENLLSAQDNLRAYDRVGSRAFKIYYDIGNSTNVGGFDVPAEIRLLGKERICQFHFKDKGYLGEGNVALRPILQAIKDIGYEGYANLETKALSGSVESDLKRNLAYVREGMDATWTH